MEYEEGETAPLPLQDNIELVNNLSQQEEAKEEETALLPSEDNIGLVNTFPQQEEGNQKSTQISLSEGYKTIDIYCEEKKSFSKAEEFFKNINQQKINFIFLKDGTVPRIKKLCLALNTEFNVVMEQYNDNRFNQVSFLQKLLKKIIEELKNQNIENRIKDIENVKIKKKLNDTNYCVRFHKENKNTKIKSMKGQIVLYDKPTQSVYRIQSLDYLEKVLISTIKKNVKHLILINNLNPNSQTPQKNLTKMISAIKKNQYDCFFVKKENNFNVSAEPSTSSGNSSDEYNCETIFLIYEDSNQEEDIGVKQLIESIKEDKGYCIQITEDSQDADDLNTILLNIERSSNLLKKDVKLGISQVAPLFNNISKEFRDKNVDGLILKLDKTVVDYYVIKITSSFELTRISINRNNEEVGQAQMNNTNRNNGENKTHHVLVIEDNLHNDFDYLIDDLENKKLITLEPDDSISINIKNIFGENSKRHDDHENNKSTVELHEMGNLFQLTSHKWSNKYIVDPAIQICIDVKWELMNHLFYFHLFWAMLEWTFFLNVMIPNLYFLYIICSAISFIALNFHSNKSNVWWKRLMCGISTILFLLLFVAYKILKMSEKNELKYDNLPKLIDIPMDKIYKRIIGIVAMCLILLSTVSEICVVYKRRMFKKDKKFRKLKTFRYFCHYFGRFCLLIILIKAPIDPHQNKCDNNCKMYKCLGILISTFSLANVFAKHPSFACNQEILKRVAKRYFFVMINYLLPAFALSLCLFIVYFNDTYSQVPEYCCAKNITNKTNFRNFQNLTNSGENENDVVVWSFANIFIKSVDLNIDDIKNLNFTLSLDNIYNTVNLMVLLTFIIFVVILVTNLLTGFAINETTDILKDVNAVTYKNLVRYLYNWEKFLNFIPSSYKPDLNSLLICDNLHSLEMNLVPKKTHHSEDVVYEYKTENYVIRLSRELSHELEKTITE